MEACYNIAVIERYKEMIDYKKLNFKSFKKIDDEEIKASIMSKHFVEDCWIKDWKSGDRFTISETKKGLVVKTEDGYELDLSHYTEERKPLATIWYNDECIAPKTDFESWKEYNIKNLNIASLERALEHGRDFRIDHVHDRWGGDYYRLAWGDMAYNEKEVRKLTKAEIKDLYTLVAFVRASFGKRLETYYKKYSNNISACGYWADR